ncbi:hypothetical protein [Chamaesiphon sp.]|uniref:hypothetical protein n=1 Tax=Chamaesiphon sp. TaxID=2814140 RepID=UPI003593DA7F
MLILRFGCQVTAGYELIVYDLSAVDRRSIDIFILGWQDSILQGKFGWECPKVAIVCGGWWMARAPSMPTAGLRQRHASLRISDCSIAAIYTDAFNNLSSMRHSLLKLRQDNKYRC